MRTLPKPLNSQLSYHQKWLFFTLIFICIPVLPYVSVCAHMPGANQSQRRTSVSLKLDSRGHHVGAGAQTQVF